MRFEPMYATTARELPTDGRWVFEPKYDGVRVVAEAAADGVRLMTRNGKDKAAQFPDVAAALQALARTRGRPLVLDGEIVALANDAPARFQALQGRMHVKGAAEVRRRADATPAAIVAFDLLADGDDDLTGLPWRTRRQRLERLLGRRPPTEIRLGETLAGEGETLLDRARAAGWEGLIAKRVDATYRPGARSRDWRKLKVEHVQEFVVGGWTDPRRTRPHLGALLLGYHDGDGRLVYAGNAGGGFTHEGLRLMRARLERLARKTPPFADPPRADETVHWVRPAVVVEVRFSEWTADGRLRQPIVLGVREDKEAREVIREPASVQGDGGASGGGGAKGAQGTRNAKGATSTMGAKGAKGAKGAAASGRRARGAPPEHHDRATRPAARKRTAAARTRTSREPDGAGDVVAQLTAIERAGGDGTLTLPDGGSLSVSSLDKLFFPERGLTKGDLLRHYARVAPLLLPRLADRPLVLKRYPDGVEGKSFFQQKAPDEPPAGVRVETIEGAGGEEQRRLVGGNLATLLYTIQLGAISVDPWNARVGSLDRVDFVILDLDPGPDVPFRRVVQVARLVKAELDRRGLEGELKTSGKRGLHVHVPFDGGVPEADALALAQELAEGVVAADPSIATVQRAVDARPAGTVYVDYLQNIVAKPVAAAYAVRATPTATVSTPLEWRALTDDLDPAAFVMDGPGVGREGARARRR